ncbi:MAG: PHP domain-containing protein [Gammaproteobacteria bacterium]
MSLHYDLHSHSTHSDGTLSPAELVRRAQAHGVDVLALTDHDTTQGCRAAAAMAQSLGMHFVAGVEISVTWSGTTLHILGLGVDPDAAALQRGLAGLAEHRDARALEIGRRLTKHGIPGAFEGAQAQAGDARVGRTHFARFLVAQGHVRDAHEAFKRFLGRGAPGHVSGEWATLEQAVQWVTDAGGQAVIAHPARYRLTATRLRRLIGEFKDCGGVGMEVVSGSHSRDEILTFGNYARQFGLLASAGSDYHGPTNPWVELGRLPALPAGCAPVWADWGLPARAAEVS